MSAQGPRSPSRTAPGFDPAQILTDAVSERDLTGARDVAAVIDARIRRRIGTLIPLPALRRDHD